ncbi:hypothetical protein PJO47_29465, partial [Mycobacterium kansasii]
HGEEQEIVFPDILREDERIIGHIITDLNMKNVSFSTDSLNSLEDYLAYFANSNDLTIRNNGCLVKQYLGGCY